MPLLLLLFALLERCFYDVIFHMACRCHMPIRHVSPPNVASFSRLPPQIIFRHAFTERRLRLYAIIAVILAR